MKNPNVAYYPIGEMVEF